jgi:hypothetical protein
VKYVIHADEKPQKKKQALLRNGMAVRRSETAETTHEDRWTAAAVVHGLIFIDVMLTKIKCLTNCIVPVQNRDA